MAPAEQQRRCALIRQTDGSYRLTFEKVPIPAPGDREVLVRVRAASLNRRDIYVLKGQYPMQPRPTLVPLSDGAGEVVSLGTGVTRFKTGDRVAANFFQSWIGGRPDAEI
ncbi:MAG TPA: alcohol dehydrogenase catalytic domain-containing protein, partial [Steroidobacteraceae bacterium]|nr:alcohol dehydrogenase catalytic domain-containing protein [Steroidobacteraceae bacterium]